MREIKFRAWDKGRMIEPMGLLMRDAPQWLDKLSSEAILMQYTGLHDKNGKEIWEGDILGFDRFSHWVVVYQAPSFCIYNVCDPTVIHTITLGNIDFREVIGNIYENPELIEVSP